MSAMLCCAVLVCSLSPLLLVYSLSPLFFSDRSLLSFSSVVFPVAGRQCTILAQKTLLYPLLNVLGTQNMSSIIDSLSQFDLDMTHYPSNITKTDTSSIDTSSGRCTPCGRAMSQNEAFECGEWRALVCLLVVIFLLLFFL